MSLLLDRISTFSPSVAAAGFIKTMRRITLEDKPAFDRYLTAYPQRICDIPFGGIFAWNSVLPHYFCEFENHLIVAFVNRDQELKFLQPIGPTPGKILIFLAQSYEITSWVRIDHDIVASLPSISRYLFLDDRSQWDYIHFLPELRALEGRKWHSKRRCIQQCRAYNPVVRPLEESMFEACTELSRLWLLNKQASNDADTVSLATALRHFKTLQLSGIAVFIQGKLEAFAVGETLNPTTYLAHFLKANREYKGLFQYTFHELAKAIPESFTFLNQEQDLGMEGIRQAKELWYPTQYVHKCNMLPSNLYT